jgi:hypothetical protein
LRTLQRSPFPAECHSRNGEAVSVSLERLARRQTLFREVNERIEELTDGEDRSIQILCECSDTDCLVTLELSKEDYERVRLVPTWFAIEQGHEIAEIERVVGEFNGYAVVEKIVGQKYAEETDLRRIP